MSKNSIITEREVIRGVRDLTHQATKRAQREASLAILSALAVKQVAIRAGRGEMVAVSRREIKAIAYGVNRCANSFYEAAVTLEETADLASTFLGMEPTPSAFDSESILSFDAPKFC